MHHLYLPFNHSTLRYEIGRTRGGWVLRDEVRDWLLDHVGSERLSRLESWNEDTWYHIMTVDHKSFEPVHEFMFKYRKDAMMFKLTWA